MKSRTILSALLPALTLGCATAHIDTVESYTGSSLSAPRRVTVYDMAVENVEYIAQDMGREKQLSDSRLAARGMSERLVKRLVELGIPASRSEGPVEVESDGVAVMGRLISIDEGSRWRRVMIGFGNGRSRLRSEVELHGGGSSERLALYETEAESGAKPGILLTLPVGAVIQGIAVAAAVSGTVGALGEINTAVASNAKNTADELARRIEAFFKKQRWR